MYEPLNDQLEEIRLIALQPGSSDEPIRVALFHAVFEHLPGEKPEDEDWILRTNLQGERFYFHRTKDGSLQKSSGHPNPTWSNAPVASEIARDIPGVRPKFEALSYTWGLLNTWGTNWGTSTDSETIQILDSSPSVGNKYSTQPIQVEKNLFYALSQLRRRDQSRTLWVDAICIDQGNMAEKSQQVAMIPTIYEHAQRVIVWLGPSSDKSNLALSTLQDLGKRKRAPSVVNKLLVPTQDLLELNSWKRPDNLDNTSLSVLQLLERSWFSRLWTVQEIHSANKYSIVKCGGFQILWSDFREGLLAFHDQLLPNYPRASRNLLLTTTHLCNNMTHTTTSNLLRMAMHRKCSNPKDMIYAVLNLMTKDLKDHIVPDYFKSARDLKIETAFKIISLGRRLDVLIGCRKWEEQPIFPSWVPHLCSHCGWDVDNSVWSYASGDSSVNAPGVLDSKLSVDGIYHSKLTFVGKRIGTTPESLFQAVCALRKKRVEDCLYSGESYQTALAWVLSSYAVRDRWYEVEAYSTLQEWKDALVDPLDSLDTVDERQWIEAWLAKSVFTLEGRRFFQTPEGWFGYAGSHVRPGKRCTISDTAKVKKAKDFGLGDEIFILPGCRFPVILRETETGYRFICRCLVYGVMDGEALLGVLPKPWAISAALRGHGEQVEILYTHPEGIQRDDPRLGSVLKMKLDTGRPTPVEANTETGSTTIIIPDGTVPAEARTEREPSIVIIADDNTPMEASKEGETMIEATIDETIPRRASPGGLTSVERNPNNKRSRTQSTKGNTKKEELWYRGREDNKYGVDYHVTSWYERNSENRNGGFTEIYFHPNFRPEYRKNLEHFTRTPINFMRIRIE